MAWDKLHIAKIREIMKQDDLDITTRLQLEKKVEKMKLALAKKEAEELMARKLDKERQLELQRLIDEDPFRDMEDKMRLPDPHPIVGTRDDDFVKFHPDVVELKKENAELKAQVEKLTKTVENQGKTAAKLFKDLREEMDKLRELITRNDKSWGQF